VDQICETKAHAQLSAGVRLINRRRQNVVRSVGSMHLPEVAHMLEAAVVVVVSAV
jgi:hypothetical protein